MLVNVGELIEVKIKNAKGTSCGMIVNTEGRIVVSGVLRCVAFYCLI